MADSPGSLTPGEDHPIVAPFRPAGDWRRCYADGTLAWPEDNTGRSEIPRNMPPVRPPLSDARRVLHLQLCPDERLVGVGPCRSGHA